MRIEHQVRVLRVYAVAHGMHRQVKYCLIAQGSNKIGLGGQVATEGIAAEQLMDRADLIPCSLKL